MGRRFLSAQRERGAAVVEFALIVPLLIGLVMGTVDTAFVMSDQAKLRQAVRETGRMAAVNGLGQLENCGLTGPLAKAIGEDGSFTTSKGGVGGLCRLKMYLADKGLTETRGAIRVFGWNGTSWVSRPGVDVANGFQTGGLIAICAQAKTSSRSGLLKPLFGNKILRSAIFMRIEADTSDPVPPATLPVRPSDAAEPSLTGTWSDCAPGR